MRTLRPIALALLACAPAFAADPPVRFDRVVIDDAFPDAYQVEVADVDGDKRPDLVVLGGPTIAWYQNPTWTKRVIATGGEPLKADIISSATRDLDGDGRAEVAIACDFAMNTPTRGQLFLASQGPNLDAPWTFRKIQDVPSIHRVRWIEWGNNSNEPRRRVELAVAGLFGPEATPPKYDQQPARVSTYSPYRKDPIRGPWQEHVLGEFEVVHAITVVEPGPKQALGIEGRGLTIASRDGITRFAWSDPRNPAKQGLAVHQVTSRFDGYHRGGSSEVQRGWLAGRDDPFWATIDPWHGPQVAIYRTPKDPRRPTGITAGMGMGGVTLKRVVLDDTLDDGHALWTADVDGDGTDEIFAGHRGKDHRVAMYRLEAEEWVRTVLDTGVAAQDLRGGDLDSDGVPDVVAVGGKTHNVVWYRPVRDRPAQ